MTEASTAVIYSQNTWDVANPNDAQMDKMIAAAAEINTSGFTALLLGQWHVWENGRVFYNDTPYEQVLNGLQVYITAFKMGGGSMRKVLMSFGPFGSDFDHIGANLDAVKQCIAGLQAMAGLDGIDFDLEQEYTSSQADTLVELTNWANAQGLIVTAAPYDASQIDFWTGVLGRVGTPAAPGFAWWNLQLYGGADYGQWVTALDGLVDDPAAFLLPGWSAEYTSADDVQTALQALKDGNPTLQGAFIWKYESAHPVTAYAKAITGVVG